MATTPVTTKKPIILEGESVGEITDLAFENPSAMELIKLREIFRKSCTGEFATWLANAIQGNPDVRTFAKSLVDQAPATYGGASANPKMTKGQIVYSTCVGGYNFVLYVKDPETGKLEWDHLTMAASVVCKPLQ